GRRLCARELAKYECRGSHYQSPDRLSGRKLGRSRLGGRQRELGGTRRLVYIAVSCLQRRRASKRCFVGDLQSKFAVLDYRDGKSGCFYWIHFVCVLN